MWPRFVSLLLSSLLTHSLVWLPMFGKCCMGLSLRDQKATFFSLCVNWHMFSDQSPTNRLWDRWRRWLLIVMHVFSWHNGLRNKALTANFMQRFTATIVVTKISTMLLWDRGYYLNCENLVVHIAMVKSKDYLHLVYTLEFLSDHCFLRITTLNFFLLWMFEVIFQDPGLFWRHFQEYNSLRWVFLAGTRTE